MELLSRETYPFEPTSLIITPDHLPVALFLTEAVQRIVRGIAFERLEFFFHGRRGGCGVGCGDLGRGGAFSSIFCGCWCECCCQWVRGGAGDGGGGDVKV